MKGKTDHYAKGMKGLDADKVNRGKVAHNYRSSGTKAVRRYAENHAEAHGMSYRDALKSSAVEAYAKSMGVHISGTDLFSSETGTKKWKGKKKRYPSDVRERKQRKKRHQHG